MTQYLWQRSSWPNLRWEQDKVFSKLLEAKKAQGYILGQGHFLNLEAEAQLFVDETFTTSAIEGENLDKKIIRSSVAKRLGIETAGLVKTQRNVDGVVEILIDATKKYKKILNHHRLFAWHAALFPAGHSGIHKIKVGTWRKTLSPMRVISGPMGKEKIHYEAPPSKNVAKEMKAFLKWFNQKPHGDGIIRSAIAHFWFITIHPFEDGNGRMARAITDMALAQDEKLSKRLYSLSSQIMNDKKKYYDVLKKTQKGDGDITEWLCWFLNIFIKSIENSKLLIEKAIFVGDFYKFHAETIFNQRQQKVIKKLLEHLPHDFVGGLSNKSYVSIAKTSPESAKRDIADLLQKKVLLENPEKGRSTNYRLNRNLK